MAALTWREVSAPSFGSANDLLRTGAQLQQNAFSGLGDAIAAAQKQQLADRKLADQGLNSQVLANALRVNNAGDYQKSLSDGTFLSGVDVSRLAPETLNALGSRASSLISQAGAVQNQGDARYKQQRTETLDQIQDAARAQQAARLGLTGPLAQLPPKEQLATVQAETGIVGGTLGNENRAFLNRTQLRDDNANEVGLNTATNIMRRSAGPLDALAQLEDMNDLTPREFAAANARLGQTFGNLYAPVSQGGQGAKPGTRSGSPFDATFNFQGTNQPISTMPIGDVLQVQDESKRTQGHSPMGAFQINKATLEDYGPKVLGKDWQSQEFTPEVQEKLSKAIFEDRKGGDLTKTWASLPNSSPGAYKDFTWDDMRSMIAQGETGQNLPSDKASLNLLTQASQQDYKRRQSQNNALGVTADIEKNFGDTRPAGEVLQDLKKNQFPDADLGDLQSIFSRVKRSNPDLSAADIGSIIARSVRDSAWYTPGTTSFGGGQGVDDATLRQNAQDYRTGKADRSAFGNQMTANEASKLDTAKQTYDNAAQNLMQLRQRQAIQPGISTERAEAAFQKAEAALKRALAAQRQDPNNRPTR